MNKSLLAFAILATFPIVASADVSKADIKKLVAAGISDDVILTYVRTHGPMAKLSSDDLVELKQAGASETVLKGIAGDVTPKPAPVQAPVTQVVEKKVYVPQTTYVYDRTPNYYTPSVYYSSYPAYTPSYYYSSSYCYPRYRSYSSYPGYRVYYSSSRYRYCRPRSGFSVGFGW